jgi:hypothetical protein
MNKKHLKKAAEIARRTLEETTFGTECYLDLKEWLQKPLTTDQKHALAILVLIALKENQEI